MNTHIQADTVSPAFTLGDEAAGAALLWADQMAAGHRNLCAMLDSSLRWWTDAETGWTQMMLPASGAQHITADSAGMALCPNMTLSPQGAINAAMGFASAMSQAWVNALEHERADAGL